MTISMLGINHKTGDLSLRGRFSFSPENLPEVLRDFCAYTGSTQVLILSTCNRTEIYSDALNSKIFEWLEVTKNTSISTSMKKENFYSYDSESALAHAIKVASSLDSLVMGEPQILGQVKKAYHASHQAGCLRRELGLFFNTVIRTAKKIRHHTPIGRCPISMAYCSLHTLGIEKFKSARILILGAGETAKKILQHVIQAGANDINLLNRTPHKAEVLAQKFQAFMNQKIQWGELTEANISDALPLVDIVISTIQLPDHSMPLVHLTLIKKIMAKHPQEFGVKPLFFIDLASPRSISQDITQLSNIELLDIDEIQLFIENNKHHQKRAETQAEELIQEAISSFKKMDLAEAATPKIIQLRENIEQLIEAELEQALREIAQGKSAELTLKKLSHRLKQKWLHTPSKTLHSAASQGDEQLLTLTCNLFDVKN
jgi:glutamyl-tRNA reductase